MDSDSLASTDGHEVAHQNGAFEQTPAPLEDFDISDNVNVPSGKSTETAVPNGNAKVAAKLDDGVAKNSSSEEVNEESANYIESNGLTIAKVRKCFHFFFLNGNGWFNSYWILILSV